MYCSSPVSLAKVSTLSCVVSTQSLTPSTVPTRSRSPARPSRTSGCRVSPGAASTLIDLILRQSVRNTLHLRCCEVDDGALHCFSQHPWGSIRQRQRGSRPPASAATKERDNPCCGIP